MQPHGSDRVRRGSGEQWILLCSRSKGWLARTPPTLTARERPGTTVLWEEQYFEVVSVTSSGTGTRYVLEPWREEHVMRTTEAYDAASEVKRESEHQSAIMREHGRRTTNLLGVLTGHLPAPVQEELGSELGVVPVRLTLWSLLLPMAFLIFVANEYARRKIAQEGPMDLWLMVLAGYLFLESALRMFIALSQSRPTGSAAGLLAYGVFYLFAPNRRKLVRPVEISAPTVIDVPPDIAIQDALMMREPLLTLLTPAEQHQLAKRYGYDYRRQARIVASVILLFSVLGVITSMVSLRDTGAFSALLSLVVAGGLGIEQVIRLSALRRGPAGSVLGPLVRPFSRKLLA